MVILQCIRENLTEKCSRLVMFTSVKGSKNKNTYNKLRSVCHLCKKLTLSMTTLYLNGIIT